jgi:hypothetical protein
MRQIPRRFNIHHLNRQNGVEFLSADVDNAAWLLDRLENASAGGRIRITLLASYNVITNYLFQNLLRRHRKNIFSWSNQPVSSFVFTICIDEF